MTDTLTIEINFCDLLAGAQTDLEYRLVEAVATQFVDKLDIEKSFTNTVEAMIEDRLATIAASKIEEILKLEYSRKFGEDPQTIKGKIDEFVTEALTERVDRQSGKSSRDNYNSAPFLSWHMERILRDIVRSDIEPALKEISNKAKGKLKDDIAKAVSAKIGAYMK